jgi:hypothetical protein
MGVVDYPSWFGDPASHCVGIEILRRSMRVRWFGLPHKQIDDHLCSIDRSASQKRTSLSALIYLEDLVSGGPEYCTVFSPLPNC